MDVFINMRFYAPIIVFLKINRGFYILRVFNMTSMIVELIKTITGKLLPFMVLYFVFVTFFTLQAYILGVGED